MKQTARKSNMLDAEIGRRIRDRRRQLGMIQEELARYLGVTAQQVQKYEKGLSRVGAGRLQQIATKLQVRVSALFGVSDQHADIMIDDGAQCDVALAAECVELSLAFEKVPDATTRHQLLALVVAVSKV